MATIRHEPSAWRSALSGLLAAGLALAFGELVAGFSKDLASPVISVGNRVVDAVPGWVKDFAIQTFGTNDKLALVIGICCTAALLGLVIGLEASNRFWVGAGGIAVFAAVGVWAAAGEVGAPWWSGAPSVIGGIVGISALSLLLATIAGADRPDRVGRLVAELSEPGPRPHPRASPSDDHPAFGAPEGLLARRSFLKMTAAVAVIGAGAASTGRWLQDRFSAVASRLAVVLPTPAEVAPPVGSGTTLDIDGLAPFITPSRDFYRIDTNLTVPQIAAESWSLTITGMVDQERTFSFEEILALEMVEERITLACVSNEVGGGLVGNALWLGTPLRPLLNLAGVREGADQVVGRAYDGFTTGFPIDVLDDGRPALLAIGMNGEPLPLAHGFPARMVVPGLYGYVSATKWLTEIELTTFADFDQYWVRRGWSARGPIKTMARIDTPSALKNVKPGPVAIAGVAWAPTRGISQVEVRIDDGPWIPAELADEDSKLTWRQWVHRWDARPGRHQITARATDEAGRTQGETRIDPFPSGAEGWHSVTVNVED